MKTSYEDKSEGRDTTTSAQEDEEDQWMETMHVAEGRTTEQPGTRRTAQTTGPTSPAGPETTPLSGQMRPPGQPPSGSLHSTLDQAPEMGKFPQVIRLEEPTGSGISIQGRNTEREKKWGKQVGR